MSQLTRLVLYRLFISNAENLGFAFRSPLLPPIVLILPENLHQQNSLSLSPNHTRATKRQIDETESERERDREITLFSTAKTNVQKHNEFHFIQFDNFVLLFAVRFVENKFSV